MKRKLLFFIVTIIVLFGTTNCNCSKKEKLYLLNWNEYINGSLITKFEKEYNCKIEAVNKESNEDMYTTIVNNQYPIDVAIPSDYMIHKLYKENLLQEIDLSKLSNYKKGLFDSKLEELRTNYFENNEKYAMPYFWGTISIMYNDRTSGIEETIKTNGWSVFFDTSLTNSSNVRVGMYNNPRDAIAVAELYLGISLNETNENLLANVKSTLINQKQSFAHLKYDSDDLKKDVAGGENLDFAMVYSGDFFDQLSILEEDGSDQYINIYTPDKTNVYFDGMVIPTTSKNPELAHKFIDFFLDTDNVVENVDYVGYCPALASAYDALLEDEYWKEMINTYPSFYPGNARNGEIYWDLGDTVYSKLDEIYRSATNAR